MKMTCGTVSVVWMVVTMSVDSAQEQGVDTVVWYVIVVTGGV